MHINVSLDFYHYSSCGSIYSDSVTLVEHLGIRILSNNVFLTSLCSFVIVDVCIMGIDGDWLSLKCCCLYCFSPPQLTKRLQGHPNR